MSTRSYRFTMLRVRSNLLRGESVNVGIVAFVDGRLVARIDYDRARLMALDPNLVQLPLWESLQADIERIADQVPDPTVQHHMLKTLLTPIYADEQLGEMTLDDEESPADRVEALMARLVVRPRRVGRDPLPARINPRGGKLNAQIRDWFKQARLYSRNMEDLSKNRVVANFPISAANDLYAEFALKNGVVHVIETLDLRGHDKINAHVHKEAAVKAIVLDQARQALEATSQRLAVVSASDYNAMRPAIRLVELYADDVIAMASSQDRQRLADFVATSLHQTHSLPILQ